MSESVQQRYTVTKFWGITGGRKSEQSLTALQLIGDFFRQQGKKKSELPLFKMARFGDKRTAKGSLRHDANVLAISGIECDYDAGCFSFHDATNALQDARIFSIVYTSPSYQPASNERWRAVCPLSCERPPKERAKYVSRVNGVLGGILSRESFTLSQSFYCGCLPDNARNHRVVTTEDRPIDLCDDLDITARGIPKPQPVPASERKGNGADGSSLLSTENEAAWASAIRTGVSYRVPIVSLVGSLARAGVAIEDAEQYVTGGSGQGSALARAVLTTSPGVCGIFMGMMLRNRENSPPDAPPGDHGPDTREYPGGGRACIPVDQPPPPDEKESEEERNRPRRLDVDVVSKIGPMGKLLTLYQGQTEACLEALAFTFITYFGNAAGRMSYLKVGRSQHPARISSLLVGRTAKARKGTARNDVSYLFKPAAPEWFSNRVKPGLATGEGVIFHVRDEVRGPGHDGKVECKDPGEPDKRLLIIAEEFYSAIAAMARQGNTLSPVLREAFDGNVLGTLTKNSPLRATGAHVSLYGQITKDELERSIDTAELVNGFINRMLFCWCQRDGYLSRGGEASEKLTAELVEDIRTALKFAQQDRQLRWSDAGGALWDSLYPTISAERLGLLGAVTARAETHVVRLAVAFALMGQSAFLEEDHLRAALEVWRYSEASARFIWGAATGKPDR
jgi:hypothetical protein